MAVVYENECCSCAVPGYPCTGEHKSVPHFYCDKCEEEVEGLYETEIGQLCDKCVLGMFEKVRID